MELTEQLLTRNEWTDSAAEIRMKFRRDGTGYYERESAEGRPFLHENLLWRVEGTVLHLKFAHARFWSEVEASAREGTPTEDGRFGQRVLELARDAYAWTQEEKATPPLVLLSDRGAPLPST